MSIIITKRASKDKNKVRYAMEWGRRAKQRKATGIFTYTHPRDQLQKNHNKEALAILETKRSQMILDSQAITSGYVPKHKVKSNFLDYYTEYVRLNPTTGNRHLVSSLNVFKKFIGKEFISPVEISETLCEGFRNYLLKNLNGETPANYFMRFKRVIKGAKKDGYFKYNPAEDIVAKSNKNKKIKEILTEEDYIKLMKTPCTNYEVKKGSTIA